jgi:hypothetical protein
MRPRQLRLLAKVERAFPRKARADGSPGEARLLEVCQTEIETKAAELMKRRWRCLEAVAKAEARQLPSLRRIPPTAHRRGASRSACSSAPSDRAAPRSYDRWLGQSSESVQAGVTTVRMRRPSLRAGRLSPWVPWPWRVVLSSSALWLERMVLQLRVAESRLVDP